MGRSPSCPPPKQKPDSFCQVVGQFDQFQVCEFFSNIEPIRWLEKGHFTTVKRRDSAVMAIREENSTAAVPLYAGFRAL